MTVLSKQERATGGAAAAADARKDPAWLEEQRATYQAGVAHAFIVDGDVEGLAYEDSGNRALLLAKLGETREVVAVWHLASGGITLYNEDDELFSAAGASLGTRKAIATAIVQPPARAAAAGAGSAASRLAGAAAAQQAGGGAGDPFRAAQQPLQALGLMQTLLLEGRSTETKRGNVAVVIDYADALVPSPAMAGKGAMGAEDRRVLVTLLAWARDKRVDRLGNQVFLTCRDRTELHPDLLTSDSGWRVVHIPPPDRDARRTFLDWYLAIRQKRQKPIALLEGLTTTEVASLTAGLNLRNLEDILLTAYRQGGLSRPTLKATKDRIISTEYSAVAEMIDPLPGGFRDIGGVDIFKGYCERRIIRPLRKGKLENVPRGMILVGPPGCLAGDTTLRISRAGKGFTLPIADVVRRYRGGQTGSKNPKLARWDETIPTYVQCPDGDTVRLTRITNAWESGVKQTYELRTAGGRSIRATAQHPFLTPEGWRRLDALRPGDTVLVNAGRSANGRGARRWYEATYTRFHPHQRRAKGGFRCPTHRLVAESRLNDLGIDDYLAILRHDEARAATLTYLPSTALVHHRDDDHHNNHPDNLLVVDCQDEHAALHDWGRNVLERVAGDTVIAIAPHGEEMTYDIEVARDEPCFLANGIAVHNTGKTYGLRALAGEISFTAVALNTAKIMGGIVGQTERNLATFLAFCRALAPVIVFVDEFDQTEFAQRGDQSGNPVAKNMFGALLQFMSDETLRGKVIVIFASNRPDKIDPAMKRSGRIDAIVPMLLPERDDRITIASVQARAQGMAIVDDALVYIGANSENWNAGDLAEVVREARLLAEDRDQATITLDVATAAMDNLMPSGLDVAERFTLLAIEAVNKRDLLPQRYRTIKEQPGELDRQLAANRPSAWEDSPRDERL